ncbi:Fis family transcriptional regulator [Skermania piniformis]|uniref:Fis family transcriptional regulator n=1 Tax=Skermania pinensis TaxID=39122 RepID=UPI0020D0734E|nr:Fis family transcriptional regulator [Skermania piniformis]
MNAIDAGARFDDTATAVEIAGITLRDKDITREAQRWTTGERGPVVENVDTLAGADLTTFISEAVKIGALALSATGQAQEARVLERLVRDAGDRAAEATTTATEATGRAAKAAAEVVAAAAAEARCAITEADAATRKQLSATLTEASASMNAEMRRLVGGDNPELLDRLQPLLARFAADLDVRASTATSEVIAKAVRQFDMSDPTSPMAAHARALDAQQQALADLITKQNADVSTKLAELTTEVRVQQATTKLAKVTPIKGDSYAARMHALLDDIAVGLGDEYVDTSDCAGRIARCKKGDGVLRMADGTAHLVIEMTDSARRGWGDYLDEAERNRGAVAALGLVRNAAQNDGHSIRTIGARRFVAAFDPERDDPALLRTLILLLRTSALAANVRTGGRHVAAAEEKIALALEQVDNSTR